MTLDFLGAGAVDTLVLTSNAIIGKDFRTAANVGVNPGGPVGLKFDKTGIYGYSGSDTKTFQLASASGKITVYDSGNFELRDFTTGNLIGNLDVEGATDDVILFSQTGNVILGAIASRMTLIPSGDITFSDTFDALRPNTNGAVSIGDGTDNFALHLLELAASPGNAVDYKGYLYELRPNITLGKVMASIQTAVNNTWSWVELTPGGGLQNPITADVDWAGYSIEDILHIEIDGTLADDTATGIIRDIVAGETITIGEGLYLEADGKYNLAKANAEATMPCTCVAIANIANDATGKALFFGAMKDVGVFAGMTTEGAMVYVSTATGGAFTETVPTTTAHIIQVVGEVKANNEIGFTFDNTYLELA